MPDEIVSGVIGAALARLAEKCFPPRRLNYSLSEKAKGRCAKIYKVANCIGWTSCAVAIAALLVIRPTELWWIGFAVGLPFLLVTTFIMLSTFNLQLARFHEFIRFYEERSRIHIYFTYTFFGLFCLIGITSTAMLVWNNLEK